MNFKQWLLAEELKSANAPNISLTPKAKPIDVESNLRILENDQRIAALGRHFKDNDGKEPNVNSPLGQWLYNKRKAFRDYEEIKKDPNHKRTSKYKWYDTDLKVAQDAGLPDDWHLFTDKYKPEDSHKLKNDQRIAALGRHFKDNDGKEPYFKSDLGFWLYNKRKAFLDHENMQKNPNYPRTTKAKWYDTDLEVGKNAGLPDDWHLFTDKYKPENKKKKINDENIKKLGKHFKNPKNKGKEPNITSPLGHWLYNKRRAFLDHENMQKNPNYPRTTDAKWYDTDLQVGKTAKLPDDWHLFTDKYKPENKLLQDFKKINDENIKELGKHFKNPKNKGKEPYITSPLGAWLYNKRRAFLDHENMQKNPNYPRTTNAKWYDTDLQVGKNAGLPDDWHLFTDKYKPENKNKKINDENIKKLGVYYKKFGEPHHKSDLGRFLFRKRKAYQDFINKTQTTNDKWYDTDEQVGINAGLPKGWHLPVEKQKISQGAKFVRNILDDLNIEHIAEFRDRFCLGKTGQCLPFDYSFEHNDQEYFIEYHGHQHYMPAYFGSSKNRQEYAKLALKELEGIKHRDNIKYNYCKQNKFPLLVIPYWIPFSEIQSIIEEFLKHDEFDEIFANPEVPEDLKEKHKQIYKKYYDMSINKT